MERLHARPALQADLRTLATAIESAIHEKSEELAGWLGELIAGVTELHQDSPEASAAWRDGLVAVLRQAWERHQAEQGVIADALAGAWVGASARRRPRSSWAHPRRRPRCAPCWPSCTQRRTAWRRSIARSSRAIAAGTRS